MPSCPFFIFVLYIFIINCNWAYARWQCLQRPYIQQGNSTYISRIFIIQIHEHPQYNTSTWTSTVQVHEHTYNTSTWTSTAQYKYMNISTIQVHEHPQYNTSTWTYVQYKYMNIHSTIQVHEHKYNTSTRTLQNTRKQKIQKRTYLKAWCALSFNTDFISPYGCVVSVKYLVWFTRTVYEISLNIIGRYLKPDLKRSV
jgi:hypothetical protein